MSKYRWPRSMTHPHEQPKSKSASPQESSASSPKEKSSTPKATKSKLVLSDNEKIKLAELIKDKPAIWDAEDPSYQKNAPEAWMDVQDDFKMLSTHTLRTLLESCQHLASFTSL